MIHAFIAHDPAISVVWVSANPLTGFCFEVQSWVSVVLSADSNFCFQRLIVSCFSTKRQPFSVHIEYVTFEGLVVKLKPFVSLTLHML